MLPNTLRASWAEAERSKVMLSADDYDADLAERYGWIIERCLLDELGDFVGSLAGYRWGLPATGDAAVNTVTSSALRAGRGFGRDSDLFGEGARNPRDSSGSAPP